VTVTDSEDCQVIKEITVTEPPALALTITSTNAADLTTSDGSASVTVTGGTVPYTYFWSNGETTPAINNLPAGNYTVTLTDGNGCIETASVIVEATCTLMAAISDTQAASCTGNDGTITLTISGVKILWRNDYRRQ